MRAPMLLSLLVVQYAHCADELCSNSLRTKVVAGKVLKNGTLVSTEDGAIYPKGTFWNDEGTTWACPFKISNCTRICSKKVVKRLEMHLNVTLEIGPSNSSITIWKEKKVVIDKQFKIVRDAICNMPKLLDPSNVDADQFELFQNGSIYFTHQMLEASEDIYKRFPPAQICIIPLNEEESRTVLCAVEYKEPTKFGIYVLYPVLFVARAIFLVLTLIAHYRSPNLVTKKNLHIRSMMCQSASMLVIGLTVKYMRDSTVDVKICISVTFIYYYFSMATSFWLNVMCVDIYLTFKGSIAQKQDVNFLYPSLYAWGGPALLTILVGVLNITSDDEGAFSPGIGSHLCWFQGFWSEMVFYNIPLGILLTINLILFCMTARQLWLLRKDSRRAFSGASRRVHAPPAQQNQQNGKSQFALYLKLFLLMSVSWIAELILSAVRSGDRYWLITDTVNCLRGALIFWFCVWSKKEERNHFLAMFWCGKKTDTQLALGATTSREPSRTSIVSTTSTTA